MEEKKDLQMIDLKEIFRILYAHRKHYLKVLPVVFVVSCAFILCFPRYYAASLSLAPESGSSSEGGAISSLASSFGFNIGDMQTSDAISPLLYPDLMEDNGFVVGLFSIHVRNIDGDIDCTYYDYLDKYQDKSWWEYPMGWLASLFETADPLSGEGKTDPYVLSRHQDRIVQAMRNQIGIDVDKKTGVISISVLAQDALICKTLADSIKEHLQVFITDYRTNKARIDERYYRDLTAQAKDEYDEARRHYASFSDANNNLSLVRYKTQLMDLENDMQLKYSTYTSMMTQYQTARAKVQERTPAFTVLKGASVPIKAAKPKRMIFVLAMCFLAFVVMSSWFMVKEKK